MEEHYLNAATKIEQVPKEQVEQRIDYKVIQKTASTGRKIKRLTKKATS